MYDLPKEAAFGFVRNQKVNPLCFGPYTVTLHFGEGIRLQIEVPFKALPGREPIVV
jgi:hypothetical protein